MNYLIIISTILSTAILFTNCSKNLSGSGFTANQDGRTISNTFTTFKTLELYKFNPSSGVEIVKIDLTTESATFAFNSDLPIHCDSDSEIKIAVKKFNDSFVGLHKNTNCLATAGSSEYITLIKSNGEKVVFNCPEQFYSESEFNLANLMIESYQLYCNKYSTNQIKN